MALRTSNTRNTSSEKRKKRTPKKITPTYLHNAGLYYLQRYAASSGHFRTVMMRKITKSCMAHPDQNREKCIAMLDDIVQKFCDTGLIDDKTYITGKIASLHRQGKSAQYITAKLIEKSIPMDTISDHMQSLKTDESDYQAAIIYAQKKRIADKNLNNPDTHRKIMGMFARAGFSYQIAKKAIQAQSDTTEI